MRYEFKPGDIVMVIHPSPMPHHPKPGAMGTIKHNCDCMGAVLLLEGYKVEFGGGRDYCFNRRCLKKINPPPAGETTTTDRELTV